MGNKIVKERLEWINPNNKIQAHWLNNYIYKKKEIRIMNALISRIANINNPEHKIKEFKDMAMNWPDTAEVRELCKQMKSAWNQKNKRKNSPLKNGEFSISKIAFSELKYQANMDQISQSKVIENALLKMKEIRNLKSNINIQSSVTLKDKTNQREIYSKKHSYFEKVEIAYKFDYITNDKSKGVHINHIGDNTVKYNNISKVDITQNIRMQNDKNESEFTDLDKIYTEPLKDSNEKNELSNQSSISEETSDVAHGVNKKQNKKNINPITSMKKLKYK